MEYAEVQLVECLSCMHEALDLSPAPRQVGYGGVYIYNPSTWEITKGIRFFYGRPWLHNLRPDWDMTDSKLDKQTWLPGLEI